MPQCTSLKYSCILLCMCVCYCCIFHDTSKTAENFKMANLQHVFAVFIILFVCLRPSTPSLRLLLAHSRFLCYAPQVAALSAFPFRHLIFIRRQCAADAAAPRRGTGQVTTSPSFSASSPSTACFVIAVDRQTKWDAPAVYYPLTAFLQTQSDSKPQPIPAVVVVVSLQASATC